MKCLDVQMNNFHFWGVHYCKKKTKIAFELVYVDDTENDLEIEKKIKIL